MTTTITLTAHMFNRTETTEHATIEEARARVLAIATAQHCTIEGDVLAGRFIPQTTIRGTKGSYEIVTAEDLGRRAFDQGRGPYPFADPTIAALVADSKVGEKTHLLRAFSAGWNAANLSAPVNL